MIADARGLPRENYRKVIDGYRWLVEQGCVVMLGPLISDNSLVLQDTVNELGVAGASAGPGPTVRLRLLLHGGQRRHPHRGRDVRAVDGGPRLQKVGMFWEQGSSGKDYADYFRDTRCSSGCRSCAR